MTKRPALTRDRIVDAALELARDPDPDALSFRRLGVRLGVHPTAVYRHFPAKGDIVAAALDRLMSDIRERLPDGLSWRERLHWVMSEHLDATAAHPAVGVDAGHRSTGGPGELAAIELVLTCLSEAGVPETEMIRFYSVLSSYGLAMAGAQAEYRLADNRVAHRAEQAWVAEFGPADPDRYPLVHRYRHELADLRHDDVFRDGLDLILDAVEAAAARQLEGEP